jgi:hypothetical protein
VLDVVAYRDATLLKADTFIFGQFFPFCSDLLGNDGSLHGVKEINDIYWILSKRVCGYKHYKRDAEKQRRREFPNKGATGSSAKHLHNPLNAKDFRSPE